MIPFSLLLGLAVLMLSPVAGAASEAVLVASPFPRELLTAYKKGFDESHPGLHVEFVNFPATNIISFLKDRAPGTRPDVFWGSSPDSFRGLRRHDLLQAIEDEANPGIPQRLGNLEIDDPEHYYRGQALSGYGIMWNTRYLKARRIPPPATWSDLASAEYFGHVVMSSPSRSGTTHLIVESILQGMGWDDGWSLILRIAGNCATITERSFGVPNSVVSGRFGLGLAVDFLALSGKYSGLPVDFAYAAPTVITPASIGLLTGGRNPEGGRAFIRFALSKEGQNLLLRPEISRLPVLPEAYETKGHPEDLPKLVEVVEKYQPAYDPDVSEARYLMVGVLFNQAVTFRHQELVRLTGIVHDIERQLARRPDPAAQTLVSRVKDLVYRPPIPAGDERIMYQPVENRPHSSAIARSEAAWARQIGNHYAEALRLARKAQDLLRQQQGGG